MHVNYERRSKQMMWFKAYEILTALQERAKRQDGQALVEYALILALIAIVSIAVLKLVGLNVKRVFTGVNTQLTSVPDTPAP
jgi:Flp pilus assembly pilin Flp